MFVSVMRIGVNGTRAGVENHFVGHELQLLALSTDLRIRSKSSYYTVPYNRLFYVFGPSGSGKHIFVERLWDILKRRTTPCVVISIDPESDISLDRQMRDQVLSNQSYFEWKLEQLNAEIDERTGDYENSGRRLPEIGRLALWSGLLQQRVIDDPETHALQILFVIHNFAALPDLYRKLLSRAIPHGNDKVDVRILVSGTNERDIFELENVFDECAPATLVKLPTLTLMEISKWLYVCERPIGLAQEILSRSGGLAGRIEETWQTLMREQGAEIHSPLAKEILKYIDQEFHKYVCMAACLPEANARTLRSIMSEGIARETLSVLRSHDIEDSKWNGDTFHFGRKTAQTLRYLLEKSDKEALEEITPIAAKLETVCAAIPDPEERETLLTLLVFNYFNRQLLQSVLPETADKLFTFVLGNLGRFFESSGNNVRLTPSIRKVIADYASVVRYKHNPVTIVKIEHQWQLRKKQITERMEICSKALDRDTETLLRILRKKRAEENLTASKTTALSGCDQARHTQHMPAAGYMMQGIGTAILCICLLNTSGNAILFGIFGVALILSGLFTDQGEAVTVETSPRQQNDRNDNASSSATTSRTESNELELKRTLLASRIAGEKVEMGNLVRQLDEPYLPRD
jgi:hypothetical protein